MNNYDIAVFRTLGVSIAQLKGAWKTIFGAAFFILLASMLFAGFTLYLFQTDKEILIGLGFLLYMGIISPLNAGFWMLGVQWIVEKKIQLWDIFRYWRLRYIGKLCLLMLWFWVRIGLPLLILVATVTWIVLGQEKFLQVVASPQILWDFLAYSPQVLATFLGPMIVFPFLLLYGFFYYIVLPYFFAIPLAFSREISVWRAITLAGQTFRKHGVKITIVFLIQLLVACIIFVPLTMLGVVGNVIFNVIFMAWWAISYGIICQIMFGNMGYVK